MDAQARLTFRRREENQYSQFFRDIVEAMLNLRGHEEHASRCNLSIFVPGSETRPSAQHVVHLIFMMRALRVRSPGGQHVESCAHGRRAQKLPVQLAAFDALRLELLR